ncbi:hypothetical protein GF359_04020 [candidate division WOR-3 bacterium]|uniref:4-vinyl reductase 4VR domain-containing protein n=1 Tax=candidate division WOR-3 bacterium TaxID=2052148 RepID=A0A9D5QCB2_UNCW3|nr:hypothetical protein [candidate division WOR-3 bacterium]MBD3364364.1 hypothetical protein [candidate division WOR-3 bacterium]
MTADKTDTPELLVRGISLISMREYVKTRLAGKDLEQFFTRFPESEEETIVNAKKGDWYPFVIQRHIRENVAKWFNPENPRKAVMDMVAFTADYEISAFLKGIIGILPVHMVLQQSAKVFGKFYNPGKMVAARRGETSATFELTGFPADPLFCPVIDAWIISAGKNMGLDVKVKETACIHNGDDLCRWEITWK